MTEDPYFSDWAGMCLDYGGPISAFQAALNHNALVKAAPVLTKPQRDYAAKKKRELAKSGQTEAQRKVAALLKKATRVNQPNFHIDTIAESIAMQDKARKIMGPSAGGTA